MAVRNRRGNITKLDCDRKVTLKFIDTFVGKSCLKFNSGL